MAAMPEPAVRLLTARWIFPVTSPPLADGAVAIQGRQIVGVGPRADLAAVWAGASRWDLDGAAVLPGLVNCHTHLELFPLSREREGETFVGWLLSLIEERRATPLSSQSALAEAGAGRLVESGTTCVGEVSSSGQSLMPLLRLGLRGMVYREILGVVPEDAEARRDAAEADLQRMGKSAGDGLMRVGLSPHSPYALSEALFHACDGVLRDSRIPCCIHVAETAEEVEFLSTGGGPIASLLYPAVGCRLPPARRYARSPIEYLDAIGALAWRPLLIHAVHVTPSDIRRMAARRVSVAHCPRSNARLSGGVAPVPDLLKHGIAVGLGTDSLASVSTLDLWEEMRAVLAAHGSALTPFQILEMATLLGARALGLAEEVGSLEVGKRADLAAVSAEAIAASDPVGSLITRTRGRDVLLTMIDGEVRYQRLEEASCV